MGILEEVLAKVDALRRTTGRNVQDMVQQPSLYVEKMTDALRNSNRGVAPVASPAELTNRELTPSERAEQTMGSLDFGGGLGVIKPKGGNWLSGQVEGVLRGLRKSGPMGAKSKEELHAITGDTAAEFPANVTALNQWIEGPLTNYVKRDMGAPNDPIRKLADQGIQLAESTAIPEPSKILQARRTNAGFPAEGTAQTDTGRAWENALDTGVLSRPASDFQLPNNLAKDPWLATVPPDTPIRSLAGHASSTAGFNHLIDELSNSLREGRLRPEQLQSGNFSVDAAVRHVAEINALRAKKAEEALQADIKGMPIHKDYPEQGMSWRQLKAPDLTPERIKYLESQYPEDNAEFGLHHINSRELQKWLTQEGDAMGHCVGGYCPDVTAGRSSIFSLRDAKGQPHVTIETQPYNYIDALGNGDEAAAELYDQIGERLTGIKSPTSGNMDFNAWAAAVDPIHDDILAEMGKHYAANPPAHPDIVQIKGKGNAKPHEKYLPFIQDFVRSGRWSSIGDAAHTGLSSKEIDQILKGTK